MSVESITYLELKGASTLSLSGTGLAHYRQFWYQIPQNEDGVFQSVSTELKFQTKGAGEGC